MTDLGAVGEQCLAELRRQRYELKPLYELRASEIRKLDAAIAALQALGVEVADDRSMTLNPVHPHHPSPESA